MKTVAGWARWRAAGAAGVMFALAAGLVNGTGQAAAQQGSAPASLLSVPARQWGAEAAANEAKVLKYNEPYLSYRMHLRNAKGDKTREVLESKDGTVARLMLQDGRRLTPEEDAAERERLQSMLDSPAAFAKHIKSEQSGKDLALSLIAMMPDAMIFSYTPGQPQRDGRGAGAAAEVVLDFKPNPAWKPPTMMSEALTGLQGRAWIDARSHYVARIDGEIFRGVNFGWGLFAHIYPGSKLSLEQVQAAGERWIFSRFSEHVTVRALMVKTVQEDSEVTAGGFNVEPAMSYQDAVKRLLALPLPDR